MRFYTETFSESLFKHHEELCGDKVSVIYDPHQTILVLADGMGSGVRANILSTLTSKIISTMLHGGASLEDCVETVSKTLPVSTLNGVAYCTFTIITVQDTGEVYMAEFDGPEVIMFRDGILDEPRKTERIIEGKRVLESHFMAEPGDVIVGFSDGVDQAGDGMAITDDWDRTNIMAFLQTITEPGMTARDYVRSLMDATLAVYGGVPMDDVTTAAVRILPARETCVMVGPASSPDRDADEVHRLMSATGKKIVCGGTTSKVVSRQLEQGIDIDYDSDVNGIPPVASIRGVDLVTEGVLTLTAAVEFLKQYVYSEVEESRRPDPILDFDRKDGAARLVRMLVDDSSDITFLLGEAANEAHQGQAGVTSSIDPDMKRRDVKELADLLQRIGKRVSIVRY